MKLLSTLMAILMFAPFVAAFAQDSGAPVVIVDDLIFPEGPVFAADGALYFCDGFANRVYKWSGGTLSVHAENTAAGNGLDLAPNGGLYVCQYGGNAFARVEADGSIATLVTEVEGLTIQVPNDVVSDSKGNAYFTCNFRDAAGSKGSGVVYYGIDGTSKILVQDLRIANGVALSPDETILYAGDIATNRVARYSIESGPTATPMDPLAELGAGAIPDGIAVHPSGDVFVAHYGKGKIVRFSADGKLLGETVFPEGATPTNIAFGGKGMNTMIVTVPGANLGMLRKTAGPAGTPLDELVARIKEAKIAGKVYEVRLGE